MILQMLCLTLARRSEHSSLATRVKSRKSNVMSRYCDSGTANNITVINHMRLQFVAIGQNLKSLRRRLSLAGKNPLRGKNPQREFMTLSLAQAIVAIF